MKEQVIVLRLRDELSRRLREHLDSGRSGYGSLQEFISMAIENQLHLEELPVDQESIEEATEASQLLSGPKQPPAFLLQDVYPIDQPLFVLTNRLAPLKVAARVLANLFEGRDWPRLEEFHSKAALAARSLGIRLRKEDSKAGRAGMRRRWVAFPVGENREMSLSRFVNSFTMWVDGERSTGPMAILGLGGIRDGRAVLTAKGWELAASPSPLIENAPGNTLSQAEVDLLRDAIMSAPSESREVQSFLNSVLSAGGAQAAVDKAILATHPGWSANMATAQRGAMIGRLVELGLLAVEGRGSKANIKLLESALELVSNGGRNDEDIKGALRTRIGD